ncbi:alanine--tRNA ligase [Methanobacterium veterum]|jgi:alanyl-tRNA synthetase|uniref:Alanine--tRNA ligase n=2 Tax=Methanobacteriaceae TaxID=2159 RepID=A0A9E4ZYP4_9EURY|nr:MULTISPECIES: alanine--tRNA ligase [Methanobacterium]MCZ3365025.1 alanine--tRNA ligase [Methanobacterium veterum]MCZ3372780.1 alanine--tRNA ligase [Methanobacterium veterum]
MSRQLEELGFTKKTCITCGNDFWSIGDRKTCGDAPCDEYTFIGNPATDKKYDLYEIQKAFKEFFAQHGHTPIKRYPVLAKRWRDDVFLVGASIYDFQPWVTSGAVEPPANPLVVAQPSIRLNDVDNVGRTGRHMTCFTMGAHHAFNTDKEQIYWEDETVKYCHDFIKSIGINPEEITYIESWWKGGGNAGPCYEICVRGVELATLVFIKYKTLPDGKLEEIPLTVVDTGYGLERFAWISQGTPTAYDASFGPVIQTLKELSGVEVDERILAENAQVAGMMDIETFADLRELRSKVADRLNISLDDLERATKPMEAIYVIADHTRCLAFMLADGVIPSNVKEGYLARLVLRRTIRFIKELGLKESLADIMKIQLDFLSKTYPEIRQSQDHIINVINLEDKRYDKTVSKGRELVKRSIKKLRKKNKTEMPFETLKELYESHGIPPETTKEISEKMEFEVKVPDNFYTLVAAEHEEEAPEEKAEIELEFPATDLLFYQKPFDTQFEAHVLGTYENNVVLDQTVFYPEGGGQPSDIGYLEIRGEKIKVLHAEKVNSTVLHRVAEEDIEKVHPYKGQIISGQIDISRRMALTRNHTATHLIVAAARKILGDHIWQAGAQKGVKKSRIDLTHYKRIEPEELQEIELLANKFVMENRPVLTNWMARAEAEKKYGFILYQGGIVPGMDIRTVVVDGIDVQACAGTHCNQTGDIGLIKITKTERIQDGVERIEFSAGEAAIEAAQRNDNILKESSDVFKVTPEQLPKTCDRFFNEWKSFKNEIDKLKGEIASLKTEGILNKTEKIGDLTVLSEIIDSDMNELIKMATDLTEKQGKVDVVLLGSSEGKIVGAISKKALENGIKINGIIKDAAAILGGGGGGRPNLAQGAGPQAEKMQEALDFAVTELKKI